MWGRERACADAQSYFFIDLLTKTAIRITMAKPIAVHVNIPDPAHQFM